MAIEKQNGDIIEFVKQKDYIMVNNDLGGGSFGKTVVLKDPYIDELFVAKKYEPEYDEIREQFYKNFLDEIKILYKLNHRNIVRIYNYYAYENIYRGYILMEFIDGKTIDKYLSEYEELDSILCDDPTPDNIFVQLIDAFSYMEKHHIIHRDIREGNIMIDKSGTVKVIDFGIGKLVESTQADDSLRSQINRRNADTLPQEYYDKEYTSLTDMFYLAELLNRLMREAEHPDEMNFSYQSILDKMMQKKPEDRYVDEEEAKIVREIFERYASGETVADIIRDLNRKKLTTSLGKPFNKNSVHRILNNRRYIGYYLYKGQETPGGMPRIIEDELFERVHYILDRNKKAPARARGREEYLLTTKLFCGYCREMMTGYGGTGKSGKTYHYYACNNFKRRKCKKKVISKEKIEDRVVLECRKLLTDSNIERIAASVSEVCESNRDTASVKRIKAAIQEADTAIENLWKALERGQAADMITERIEKRQHEKEELQAQLAVEMAKQVTLTAPQVRAYLYSLKQGDKNDENIKRGIINIFLRAVYLYDDRFTLVLNGSDTPITIDDILLDEIEEGLEGDLANCEGGSSLVADAPPRGRLKCGMLCGCAGRCGSIRTAARREAARFPGVQAAG